MKSFLSLSLTLALSAGCLAQISTEDGEFVNKVFYPATVLLYSQGDEGNLEMRCTATAFERTEKGYRFVTAAHCACKDDTKKERASADTTFFYITSDEEGEKNFLPAKLLGCGYQHKGDDIALFDVKTKHEYPIIPLGSDPKTMDPLINVASPLGLGKQIFVGMTTAAAVDRPIVQGDINWTHAALVQLPGTDGGSSGSSIVCLHQKAICAFLVGTIDETTMVAMPVSRMISFKEKLLSGTYKYWDAESEDLMPAPVKAPDKKKSL